MARRSHRHRRRNPPLRRSRRGNRRWVYIIGLVVMGVLAYVAWADFSAHGHFMPGRAIDAQLSRLTGSRPLDVPGISSQVPSAPAESRQSGTEPASLPTDAQATLKPVPTASVIPARPTLAPTVTSVLTKTARVEPTLSPVERELLISRLTHELVNEARTSHYRDPLEYDEDLALIARNHSKDMAASNYFSHDNLRGEDPSTRAQRQGYHCRRDFGFSYSIGVAENIYEGYEYGRSYYMNGVLLNRDWLSPQNIAEQAVESWMGSSGHRANILDRTYTKEGIGVAIATDGRVYFTQNFC